MGLANGRIITAREATIKTTAVEVKALTISGRQVTLSVFRQLKDEAILDEDTVQLRGVPWGIVNYFWGDCAKASEHLHVVWQKGDELRRACVYPKPESTRGWVQRQRRMRNAFLWWIAAVSTREDAPPFAVALNPSWDWRKADVEAVVGDRLLTASLPRYGDQTVWTAVARLLGGVSSSRERDAEIVANGVKQQRGTLSPSSLHRETEDLVGVLFDFEVRWAGQVAALSELDHLFIAV